jgi:sugar lactone lactonase YvrE
MKSPIKALCLVLAVFFCFFFANACAHADNIYVSNQGNNTIEKFDSSGTDLGAFASSGLNVPYGLAFNSSGNLYVANNGNNTIEKIAPDGTPSLFANSGLSSPAGLAFDSSGNLYAVNRANHGTIEKFDSNGNGSLFATSSMWWPTFAGFAFDSSGNLYAANENNYIEKFDLSGNGSQYANTPFYDPIGLAIDSSGYLYVSNYLGNTIIKFDLSYPYGQHYSVFANSSSGLNKPAGLAFDSSGYLYVVNAGNNTIEKFDSLGNGSVFASSGLSQPMFIAVQTPEPCTLGLLGMAAFSLIAYAWRRRK